MFMKLPSAAFLVLPPLLLLCLILHHAPAAADVGGAGFTFNGFRGANITLDGTAALTPDGVLQLSNATKLSSGHAFYPIPISWLNTTTAGSSSSSSFSTTFVFAIRYTQISGHGIVLLLTPTLDFIRTATVGEYLGVFNKTNNGDGANRIFAVELDTTLNPELHDVNDNHVGIDADGLVSVNATPAGYYPDDDDGGFRNLSLSSGERMQVWVDYDGDATRVDVTLAPFKVPKPKTPLLSAVIDAPQVLFPNRSSGSNNDDAAVFVGFSASTDPFLTSHYILGWSFSAGAGSLAELDLAKLPPLPPTGENSRGSNKVLAIWLPITAAAVVTASAALLAWYIQRRRRYAELVEEWEREYGPNRFSYRTLFDATKGFRPEQLLGSGGFGSVYKGVLHTTGVEIAVKKISHESRQGIREFVAEIVSIGRVRHRNLVQLLGYCRRKGELLLVYEYMPNGSLDSLLFSSSDSDGNHNRQSRDQITISWPQRFRVVKGVASGLQYLHEEWEQVVIHRDIKSSNVLLDGELNGRLGDFGLARLYDHGTDPQTTHIVGTMGYLAPELARTSKATKATDVFAFGTFLLEVATGRRPIELSRSADEEVVLADWVLAAWKRGAILDAADPRLGGQYVSQEMELLLTLGLLCCHPLETARPHMRHVLRFLTGDAPLPEVASSYLHAAALDLLQVKAPGDSVVSYSSSFATESLVWEGR